MESWKKNVAANFIGQGWVAVLGLLVAPIYIRLLGIEGYGLIGFYMMLQDAFNALLDLGLTVTVNREVARYSASPEKSNSTRDLVRTLEIGYWLIGLVLAALIIFSSSWIADFWIQPKTLASDDVRRAVWMMGVAAFFQWPLTFYQGGLLGLQKMVLLNKLNIVFFTLRNAGAALALWLFAPTITVFFQWQIFAIGVHVLFMLLTLWRALPSSDHAPRFEFSLLKAVSRFAAGVSASSVVAFFISMADRVILSKILPLESFGYYAVAKTVQSGFNMIAAQISRALFPSFSALMELRDQVGLKSLFRKGGQTLTALAFSLGINIALFAKDLLWLWTRDEAVAKNAAPIVAALVLASSVNALIGFFLQLMLASGWASFGFYANLIALPFFLLAMFGFSLLWGGTGAALALLALNVAYLGFTPFIVHRKILHDDGVFSWYARDFALPAGAAALAAFFARWLLTVAFAFPPSLFLMITCGAFTLAAASLAASEIRGWLWFVLRKIFPR